MIFKKHEYFPMLLGNGVDSALIDWGGSIRTCDKGLEHVERNWYKFDRRDCNGKLLPLFFTGHILTHRHEQHLIRKSEQKFDPGKAIFHSKVYAAGFELNIDSFMTDEHLLVSHFTFIKVPGNESDNGLELILSRPEKAQTDAQYEFKITDDGRTLDADYCYAAQKGHAFLLCDAVDCCGETGFEYGSLTWNGAVLKVKNIKAGASLTGYCFVGDNLDYPDPVKNAEAVKEKIRTCGYDAILRQHLAHWKNYHQQSKVKTGDRATDYLIMLSNYLLKIYQNPVSGAVPAGLYPMMWQGKIFWDSFFFHGALLKGSHVDEAEKLSCFWLDTLPQARKNAELWKQKYGKGSGARYGWCTDRHGQCELITEIKEFHNNPVVALLVWNQFKYTRNKQLLATLFPVMKEAVDFILSYAVREVKEKAYIINCEGVDESSRNHNGNDSWTVGATIAALQALIEAADELDIKLPVDYAVILKKLLNGLEDNHNKDGVLMSSLHAESTGFGSMIYLVLPEYPSALKTMQELWDKQGSNYSICQVGTPRQDAKNVPWFQAWAAAIWAQLQDSRALEYLSECRKHTSIFGALPEQVRPDGSLYKIWFGTAHACFLWAVYQMLVTLKGNTVRVGFLLPDAWQNMEFYNIRLPNGLLISCRLKQSRVDWLQIKNSSDNKVEFTLESGPAIKSEPRRQKITLDPDAIWET